MQYDSLTKVQSPNCCKMHSCIVSSKDLQASLFSDFMLCLQMDLVILSPPSNKAKFGIVPAL